jgi:predicted tellurium resistance membrane protein TerC
VERVDLLPNPEVWVAFVARLAPRIVLEGDNNVIIFFSSKRVSKLREGKRALARCLGLGLAPGRARLGL